MKRFFLFLVGIVAAISCNNDNDSINASDKEITPTLSLNVATSAPSSRVDVAENGDEWAVTWNESDALSGFSATQSIIYSMKFSMSEGGYDPENSNFTGKLPYNSTSMRLVHPYNSTYNFYTNEKTILLKLRDQAVSADFSHLGATTFMVSNEFEVESVTTQTSTTQTPVSMSHIGAAMELRVKFDDSIAADEADYLIEQVVIGNDNVALPVEGLLNIEDGSFTATEEGRIILSTSHLAAVDGVYTLRFNAFPFSLESGEELPIYILFSDKDGNNFVSTAHVTATQDVEFARATKNTIYAKANTPENIKVNYDSISDAKSLDNLGSSYYICGTVMATSKMSIVVSDETGSILLYLGKDPECKVGDTVTVSGTTSFYNHSVQFSPASVLTLIKEGSNPTYPTAETMFGADFNAYANNVDVKYVTFNGTISGSGAYVNVTIEGTDIQGSLTYPHDSLVDASLVGANVKITGYTVGLATAAATQIQYAQIVATSVELAEEVTYDSISDAKSLDNVGSSYDVCGTVMATSKRSIVISDETGSILLYLGKEPECKVGDTVTVSGTTSTYAGIVQFSPTSVLTLIEEGSNPTYPEAETMLGADFNAYANNIDVKYVTFNGIISVSGAYVNVAINGTDIQGSLTYPYDSLVDTSFTGNNVKVTGYAVGLTTAAATQIQYAQIVATSVELADNGGTTTPNEGEDFIIDQETMGNISGSAVSGTVNIGGVDFEYKNLSTDDAYHTLYINYDTDSYIRNTSAFADELTQIVISSNGYLKSNLKLSAGATIDTMTEVTTDTPGGGSWGSEYIYIMPKGTKYVSFDTAAGTTHDAALTYAKFKFGDR